MTYTLTRHLSERGYPVEVEGRRFNVRGPFGMQFPTGTDAKTAKEAVERLNRGDTASSEAATP